MIQIHYKRGIIAGVPMMAQLRSFVIFQGIQTSIAKKPYIFVIFQGGGLDPLPPHSSGSAHFLVLITCFYFVLFFHFQQKVHVHVVMCTHRKLELACLESLMGALLLAMGSTVFDEEN